MEDRQSLLSSLALLVCIGVCTLYLIGYCSTQLCPDETRSRIPTLLQASDPEIQTETLFPQGWTHFFGKTGGGQFSTEKSLDNVH